MKKILLYSITLLTVASLVTACTSEDDIVRSGDEMTLSFTAALDGIIDSRAVSDGTMVDKLIFIVYDENGEVIPALVQSDVPVVAGKAQVITRVVKGHCYSFAFWAQNSECQAYSFSDDMHKLNVNYEGMHANDEARDAFFAFVDEFAQTPVTEPFERDVTLRRPFAQLNFGTTTEDLEAASNIAPPTGSRISIESGVYSSLDLFTGVAGDPVSVELQAGPFIQEPLMVAGEQYEYLSMNYLLVNSDKSNITGVTMTTVMNRLNQEFIHEFEVESLPVQRNFRTNVVGRLITKEVDFNIIIDASFTNDDSYYPNDVRWDGVDDIEQPYYSAVSKTYRIDKPSQLAWFQDNAPVEGSTIVLRKSLDFNNLPLRPLLCGTSNITFNGQGYSVRNLTLTAEGSAALFGNASHLTVTNLTVDRATVTAMADDQGNVCAGAIVAHATGSLSLTGVMVNRTAINGACMVGALVGCVDTGACLNAESCHVVNSTVENTDVATRQGLAGGMVGFIASGATTDHVFNACEIYNTVIKARMSNPTLASSKLIGAIQGAANSDVVRINNTPVMAYFEGLDEAAAAQQSPYGNELIGGNQQGNGHVYINNVEVPLNH